MAVLGHCGTRKNGFAGGRPDGVHGFIQTQVSTCCLVQRYLAMSKLSKVSTWKLRDAVGVSMAHGTQGYAIGNRRALFQR